jgi:hypothetical protein
MRTIHIYGAAIAMLIAICLSSCKKNRKRDYAVKIVTEWAGKKVLFPKGIPCTSMGIKDTSCVDLYNDNYKILLYVDSLGCTNCRLKLLSTWKKIIEESDTVFGIKPEFAFFFQPKKAGKKDLQHILKQHGFRYPVFIDNGNEIGKLNNFPSDPEYQCFLLNRDNTVLMVGNPSYNQGIWTLFKKIITRRDSKQSSLSVHASLQKKKGGAQDKIRN